MSMERPQGIFLTAEESPVEEPFTYESCNVKGVQPEILQ